MIEILTREGGSERCLLARGGHIKKNTLKVELIFWSETILQDDISHGQDRQKRGWDKSTKNSDWCGTPLAKVEERSNRKGKSHSSSTAASGAPQKKRKERRSRKGMYLSFSIEALLYCGGAVQEEWLRCLLLRHSSIAAPQ